MLLAGVAGQCVEVLPQRRHLQQEGDQSNGNSGIVPHSCNVSHYTRLEFLIFNGNDFTEWLYKAEKFFEIDNTVVTMKVKLASIHFEGKALHYFKSFLKHKGEEEGDLLG